MINSKKPSLELKHFYCEKQIGSGTWGRVYKAKYQPDSLQNPISKIRKNFAIKSVDTRSKKNRMMNETNYIEKTVKKEVHIHAELSHPNIVRLYAYIDDIAVDGYFHLVMEYVGSADLFNLTSKYKLNEMQIVDIMLQTSDAIAYCHSRNIMHRDIKMENVLYSRRRNTVKLIDFGLATRFVIPLTPVKYDSCGTPEYQAYEMVCNQPYDERVDVWSMGVLFFELLAGISPFNADSYKEIEHNIKTREIKRPELTSGQIDPYYDDKWDIIEVMLVRNYTARITSDRLKECIKRLKSAIVEAQMRKEIDILIETEFAKIEATTCTKTCKTRRFTV